jgi:hypothetical protein
MGVIRHACEKCAQGGSFASQIRQNERRFDSLSGKFETCSSASRTGSTLISVSLADDFQSKPLLFKYGRVLSELGLPKLDENKAPVKAMATLIKLRNTLAHYKLATQTVGGKGEQRALTKLEEELQQYFPDYNQPGHNPMTGLNNVYIPDRVIGHAVAEWSVQTAVAFLEHFRQLLSVKPQPRHRWPTQVMLMTR